MQHLLQIWRRRPRREQQQARTNPGNLPTASFFFVTLVAGPRRSLSLKLSVQESMRLKYEPSSVTTTHFNRLPVQPTAALSCQLPPYPVPTAALSYQLPSYPANRRPIHPTAALSRKSPPCPAKCRPILPTAALYSQPPPYPANCRHILATSALSNQTHASPKPMHPAAGGKNEARGEGERERG